MSGPVPLYARLRSTLPRDGEAPLSEAPRLLVLGLGFGGLAQAPWEALDALRSAYTVLAAPALLETVRALRADAEPFSLSAARAALSRPGQVAVALEGHPLMLSAGTRALLALEKRSRVHAAISPAGWALAALPMPLRTLTGLLVVPASHLSRALDPKSFVLAYALPAKPGSLAAAARAALSRRPGTDAAAWVEHRPGEEPRAVRGTLAGLAKAKGRAADWGMLALAPASLGSLLAAPAGAERVRVVGLGLPQLAALCDSAAASLDDGGPVYTMDVELPFFQALAGPVRPIGDLLGPDGEASPDAFIKRVLASAKRAPTSAAIYGHPMVYEPFCRFLVEACAAKGVPFKVVPGVSTVEALLAQLGLSVDERTGLQVTNRYHVEDAELAPSCHLVIFKPFEDLGLLPALSRRLSEELGADREALLVRTPNWSEGDVRRTKVGRLAKDVDRAEVFRTLVIPAR